MKKIILRFLPLLALATVLAATTNLHAQQENTTLLSHLSLGNDDKTADIWVEGNYAYVARLNLGLDIIDISDKNNPAFVANILPFAHVQMRDVQVHNNIAYIGNYIPNQSPTPWVGLFIYDVSNPSNPVELGRIEWGAGPWYHLGASVYNIYIDANQNGIHAYLASRITSALEVFDVSNPTAPVWLSSIIPPLSQYGTIPGYAHDAVVVNGTCYAAWDTGGFTIHDVSNPATPSLLVHNQYSGAHTHNVWPTADGLHLCTTDYSYGGDMKIWDISNLNNVSLISSFGSTTGALIHKVIVQDDLAYLSYFEDGMRIADISDPGNPQDLAWYDPDPQTVQRNANGVWGAFPYQGNIFLSHRTEGLYIVGLEDTVNITQAAWSKKNKTLTVKAESSLAPFANLTLNGYGSMTYNPSSGLYEITAPSPSKPRRVTVSSDLGGSDTSRVRKKK